MHSLSWLPGAWLVVELDNRRIIAASQELVELLGGTREQYIGRSFSILSGQQNEDDWTPKRFDQNLLERPGRYEDIGVRRADGSVIGVEVQISQVPVWVKQPAVICAMVDRSEQRNLARELIGKHQELRRAFAELTEKSRQLMETQEALKKRNREISAMSTELSRASELAVIGELTAELTHHLNNPLAAAIGAQRYLDKVMGQKGPENTGPMLDLLRNSLERLRTTMDDLRHVYKTSRPVDVPQSPFDLLEQIRGALTLMQQRLEQVDLIVDLPDTLPPVLGRASQIQHVIINLLDNAAQAVGQSGSIRVIAAEQEGTVMLTISDSGRGISEALREKVFEPFFTTREQGSGLGLALVRRNLQMDGASVELNTCDLGGAEFTLTFPSHTQERGTV